jgi:hypothetical protein
MKGHPDISNVFDSIKKMPVEIEYTDIEKFVFAQPATVFVLKSFFSTTKFIIMSTGIATLITTAAIFISLNNGNPTELKGSSEATLAPMQKEIQPEQMLSEMPPLLNQEVADNAISPIALILPDLSPNVFADIDTTKRKQSVATSTGPGYSMTHVVSGDSTYTSTQIGAGNNGSYSYTTNGSGNNVTTIDNGVSTFTSFDCDKGDDYVKVMETSMAADGLIKSENKYKYILTETNFIVNGKNQNEELRVKYLQLLLDNSCFKFDGDYQIAFSKDGSSTSLTTSSGK